MEHEFERAFAASISSTQTIRVSYHILFADVLVRALVPNRNEDEENEGKIPDDLESLAQSVIGNGQIKKNIR